MNLNDVFHPMHTSLRLRELLVQCARDGIYHKPMFCERGFDLGYKPATINLEKRERSSKPPVQKSLSSSRPASWISSWKSQEVDDIIYRGIMGLTLREPV
jgi:hypothetical protein